MATKIQKLMKGVLQSQSNINSFRLFCSCNSTLSSAKLNGLSQKGSFKVFKRCFVKISDVRNRQSTGGGTGAEDQPNNFTHFGFENVTESEKKQRVYDVFANVAESYDLMNDVMSGGLHRLWKDYFVRKSNPLPGKRLLDVAGGTGDIAFRYLDGVLSNLNKEDVNKESLSNDIVICDINKSMLEVGRRRAQLHGIDEAITFTVGDAEKLPFEEDSFDLCTIAFGIRNVNHIDKVLDEAYRVLRPGGRFMCLEFSDVSNPLLKSIYDKYSFEIIPVMGKVIAKDWNSYRYLVESIRQFPDQDTFSAMIADAGFSNVDYENLLFGVVAIHSGYKI